MVLFGIYTADVRDTVVYLQKCTTFGGAKLNFFARRRHSHTQQNA
jgi:hypothetical protein